jgi:hypothetical protein
MLLDIASLRPNPLQFLHGYPLAQRRLCEEGVEIAVGGPVETHSRRHHGSLMTEEQHHLHIGKLFVKPTQEKSRTDFLDQLESRPQTADFAVDPGIPNLAPEQSLAEAVQRFVLFPGPEILKVLQA